MLLAEAHVPDFHIAGLLRGFFALDLHSVFATGRAYVRERLPEIELLQQHFAPAQADVPDFRTGGPRLHFFALALHSVASVQ